jgi:hypothetical protein
LKSLSLKLIAVGIGLIWANADLAAQGQVDEYSKTPNGLAYKFLKTSGNTQKPVTGNMVTVSAFYQTKDTIFYDSRTTPMPYSFPILEQTYHGDLFEGLRMMSVGDSAEFVLNGDSLFFKTFRVKELPKYMKPKSSVWVRVKMLRIQSREEFEVEWKAKMEKIQQQKEKSKALPKKDAAKPGPKKANIKH